MISNREASKLMGKQWKWSLSLR